MEGFGLHPSQELRDLLSSMEIPHQGQDPRKVRVIFVRKDANYSLSYWTPRTSSAASLSITRTASGSGVATACTIPSCLPNTPCPEIRAMFPITRSSAPSAGACAKAADQDANREYAAISANRAVVTPLRRGRSKRETRRRL